MKRSLVSGTVTVLCAFALCCLAPGLYAESKETYGTDDRQDVFEITDPFVQSLADAVCAIMDRENLRDNGNGTFTILAEPNVLQGTFGGEIPMCGDEPFSNQPYAAYCTGFLVKSDVIATAGHCVEGTDPATMRIVFGWEMLNANTPATTISEDQVYFVEEIIDAQRNFIRDHAILRLDRNVTAPGAQPLEVRESGRVAMGAPVGIIGHPMGLPKKVAFGATTEVYGDLRPFVFYSNFDASGGNSGSPVFDQETGVVEGIYVFSDVDDFMQDGNCFRVNRVADIDAAQGVMRSTNFSHLIPGNTRQKLLPMCGAESGSGQPFGPWTDLAVMVATAAFLAAASCRRFRGAG